MIDIVSQINDTHRAVGSRGIPAGKGVTVMLRRRYDAPIEDVWSACTDPGRLSRWFIPVTGDLRLGGTYQLEGNAGGEILHCEPPHLLKVTWALGDLPTSEVEVRLYRSANGETLLELEHAAVVDPKLWAAYGPGAVGVGWDLTLLGLSMHLSGDSPPDTAAWEEAPETRELIVQISQAWGSAHEAAGETAEQVALASQNTLAFYAPDVISGS
jgi:uncharacterized protein YndB with AHSA1/START domain